MKCEDCKGMEKEREEAVCKLVIPELKIICYLCKFHTNKLTEHIKDFRNNGLTKRYKYTITQIKTPKEKVLFS